MDQTFCDIGVQGEEGGNISITDKEKLLRLIAHLQSSDDSTIPPPTLTPPLEVHIRGLEVTLLAPPPPLPPPPPPLSTTEVDLEAGSRDRGEERGRQAVRAQPDVKTKDPALTLEVAALTDAVRVHFYRDRAGGGGDDDDMPPNTRGVDTLPLTELEGLVPKQVTCQNFLWSY